MFQTKVLAGGMVFRVATEAELKEKPDIASYPEAGVVEIVFESENRNYMRNLELLCQGNKFPCETTVAVAPRVVSFKGLSPTPAAAAKVDAKADIKAANKDK